MFAIGQQVQLWQIKVSVGQIKVIRSVMVRVTDIKTSVPGEFSREPVSAQSLRAVAEDGTLYEKHWESWPESQTNTFQDQWSYQKEGGDFWLPKESVGVYSVLTSLRKNGHDVILVGPDNKPIVPSGDNIIHCDVHDEYYYGTSEGSKCFWCSLEEHGRQLATE